MLFRRLKNGVFFLTLPGLAILHLSQARSALKIAIPRLQQRPAWYGKRTAVFLLVSQVPLYSCAIASLLWESCPVTRSPSCERLHRQTACHHRPGSSLRPRICLVGRNMAPSQPQTAPAQPRCDRREDKKTKQTSVLDFAIWDDLAVIFTVYKGARRLAKIIDKTQKIIGFYCGRAIQWAFRSNRPDPVSARTR